MSDDVEGQDCPTYTAAESSAPASPLPRPWDWRKARGGWTFSTDRIPGGRLFHAYDVNDLGACKELGLIASCEEPNEGSDLCPACIEVVKANPAGREKRAYAGASSATDDEYDR